MAKILYSACCSERSGADAFDGDHASVSIGPPSTSLECRTYARAAPLGSAVLRSTSDNGERPLWSADPEAAMADLGRMLATATLTLAVRSNSRYDISSDVHDLASFRWLRRATARRGPCDAAGSRRFRCRRSGVLRRTSTRATRSAPDAIAVRYVGAAWGCPSRTSSTSSTIPPLRTSSF
jgi:hypothetical protein